MNNPQRTSPRLSNSPKILNSSEEEGEEFSFSEIVHNNEGAQGHNNTINNCIHEISSNSYQNDANSNSSGNEVCATDPTIVNLSLYIHKLDLLYQSLEGRVQKLESFITNNIVSNVNSNSNSNSNAHNLILRKRTMSNSMINDQPIDDNVNVNNDNSFMNMNSEYSSNMNISSSNLSNLTTFLHLDTFQKDEISKSDLDDYCLPLLQKKAAPSIGELNSIVMSLKKLKYPDFDNKFILSKVREWFRRKREYMSQRINNVCIKMFTNLDPNLSDPPLKIEDLIKQARNDPSITSEIAREANLEIVNEAAALEFCSEKISSYLDNLISSMEKT